MATERLLLLLNENKAVFIVIGATAFPVYGYARATLDKVLRRFGYDLEDLTATNFLTHKVLIRQFDLETDIHPFVKGVDFRDIWKSRIKSRIGNADVYFPSLEMMIRMKQNAGRAKDREALKFLRRLLKKKLNSVKSVR